MAQFCSLNLIKENKLANKKFNTEVTKLAYKGFKEFNKKYKNAIRVAKIDCESLIAADS